jgi:hypothetical protein
VRSPRAHELLKRKKEQKSKKRRKKNKKNKKQKKEKKKGKNKNKKRLKSKQQVAQDVPDQKRPYDRFVRAFPWAIAAGLAIHAHAVHGVRLHLDPDFAEIRVHHAFLSFFSSFFLFFFFFFSFSVKNWRV